MKQGYTHIIFVIDRSGSMNVVRQDTIGGFNVFLKKQQAEAGEATATLVLFDGGYPDEYIVRYDFVPLAQVPELTTETYVPRGWTKLYDALGMTIVREGEKLAAMKEEDRPSAVLVLALTDGQENRSTEYERPQLVELIKQQKEVYGWTFTFMGSDEIGVQQAHDLGFDPGNVAKYTRDSAGTRRAWDKMSAGTAQLRAQVRRAPGGQSVRSKSFYSQPKPCTVHEFINDICVRCGEQED